MAKYSRESYIRIFDQLLSQELSYSSVYATEANIATAIKRVLGNALKSNYISLYSNLEIDTSFNVHFQIKNSEGDFIQIDLFYGE